MVYLAWSGSVAEDMGATLEMALGREHARDSEAEPEPEVGVSGEGQACKLQIIPGTNRLPARGSSAVWVVLSLKLRSKKNQIARGGDIPTDASSAPDWRHTGTHPIFCCR